jgi:hypothetical protein
VNKVKLWLLNRAKEKTTWVGIIAIASIFGYGGFDSATTNQIAESLALIVSAILIGHKEQ